MPENNNGIVTIARQFRVTANGLNFTVFISQEAYDDKGLEQCMRVAEKKISSSLAVGQTPKNFDVTMADFKR
jgi:hypothetical protein